VREAIGALGYVYNRPAAQLRGARTGLVGLVINDLRNPFFGEFAASVQMEFAARGYATVIANTDGDPVVQAQVTGSMIEHGVSALLISAAYGDEEATFGPLARASVPTIQVLRKVDPRTDLFPFLAPDYAAGTAAATRHLIGRGAQRIAFVGGLAARPVTQERLSGYLAELDAAGLPARHWAGPVSRSFGRETGAVLAASDLHDAAICYNDLVALGLLVAFNEAERPLGDRFRLIGIDDIEAAGQVWPPLTTVACDIDDFGADAAARMLDWLETGVRPAPETRTPVRLVTRASTLGRNG
jgi:LacI family transcriptional regulator